MQGVGHHLARAHQPLEHPALGEAHDMAQRELLLDRTLGRHPVVEPAGQVADLGVQRAAESDVDLLKAAADAEEGLAARHACPHQRQGDRIAAAVEGAMRLGLGLAVFLGVDIGPPASQQEAVAARQQFLDGDETRIGRDQERHAAGDLCHGGRIHRPPGVDRVVVVQQVHVADDADDRSRHCRPAIFPLGKG